MKYFVKVDLFFVRTFYLVFANKDNLPGLLVKISDYSWPFYGAGGVFSRRFDFVIYEKGYGRQELPILAIELDGKEHVADEVVRRRDMEKEAICRNRGLN